jgi:hypothetical protein
MAFENHIPLPDTLVEMKLVSARRVSANHVLEQQPQELAGTYRPAGSAPDALKRLTALRAAQHPWTARYLGSRRGTG